MIRARGWVRMRVKNLPINGTTDKPFKLSTDRSQRCNLEVKSVRAFFLLLCAPVSSSLRSRVCMSAFIHLFVHGRTQGWKSTRVLRSRSCRCKRGTRYSSVGPIHEHRGSVCSQGWRGDWPVPRCRLEEPRGRSLARHRLRYPGPPCTHSNIRTHTTMLAQPGTCTKDSYARSDPKDACVEFCADISRKWCKRAKWITRAECKPC